jgi:glycine dehydrogenase
MPKSPASGGAPERSDLFPQRHLGPRESDLTSMLEVVGARSLDHLVDLAVPSAIRLRKPLDLPPARGEAQVLGDLRALESQNQVFRSYLGMGYADCITRR